MRSYIKSAKERSMMFMREKISGVYKITNMVNGLFYISSSKDIHTRWKQHKKNLRNGDHNNTHLQNAWNLYGE